MFSLSVLSAEGEGFHLYYWSTNKNVPKNNNILIGSKVCKNRWMVTSIERNEVSSSDENVVAEIQDTRVCNLGQICTQLNPRFVINFSRWRHNISYRFYFVRIFQLREEMSPPFEFALSIEIPAQLLPRRLKFNMGFESHHCRHRSYL